MGGGAAGERLHVVAALVHRDGVVNIEAKRGCEAPQTTTLIIHGAFVNNEYKEVISPHKKDRSKHIHDRGYS